MPAPAKLTALIALLIALAACSTPTPTPEPGAEPRSCSLTNNELEVAEASWLELALACLAVEHPLQGRAAMHYDPVLGELARARAQGMAVWGFYDGHVDQDGFGPNHYLCQAEYHPTYCGDDPEANSVESIAMWIRYSRTAAELNEAMTNYNGVFERWLNSPGHRRHLLGEIDYFAGTTHYGVGHAIQELDPDEPVEEGEGRRHRAIAYWVFIAAVPPEWPAD